MTLTQIRNTEIFIFIVFHLLNGKVMFYEQKKTIDTIKQ